MKTLSSAVKSMPHQQAAI